MSRLGEAAREMQAILERHPLEVPTNGLSPSLRAQMVASGWLVEADALPPVPHDRKMTEERRARIAAAVAEYAAIEQPAPYGTLRRVAARHGIDYATLANWVHKARRVAA